MDNSPIDYDTTASLQQFLHSMMVKGQRWNERENLIHDFFWMGGERYKFDFDLCTIANGWVQYDTSQDASYFGAWVNVDRQQTLTYTEGDITLVTCPTKESFKAELDDASKFYGAPPPAFKTIDDDGTVTHYYDERPTVN